MQSLSGARALIAPAPLLPRGQKVVCAHTTVGTLKIFYMLQAHSIVVTGLAPGVFIFLIA